ncbi:MAG: ribonuclease D [Minwuia sp.]|uniref:ribonuclease D n=1 Tax=Minwuia sp. TaxID=2493630 RepID=UPI003A878D83
MTIHFHRDDLPPGLSFGDRVAVDTETMGLIPGRDRLCLVQLSAGDGEAHLVQIRPGGAPATRLKALMEDRSVLKLFHFGRFDIAALKRGIGAETGPVFCTKIASRLCRTYTDRHSLRNLCQELLGVDISKQQQSSDWGADELTDAQKEYAASDVLYLHRLVDTLAPLLEREGRMAMAQACFDFLPARADLDLAGWPETDIFAHS